MASIDNEHCEGEEISDDGKGINTDLTMLSRQSTIWWALITNIVRRNSSLTMGRQRRWRCWRRKRGRGIWWRRWKRWRGRWYLRVGRRRWKRRRRVQTPANKGVGWQSLRSIPWVLPFSIGPGARKCVPGYAWPTGLYHQLSVGQRVVQLPVGNRGPKRTCKENGHEWRPKKRRMDNI